MNGKLTLPCAFALALACSPAFAEEGARKAAPPPKAESGTNLAQARKKGAEAAGRAKAPKAALRKTAKEEEGKEAVCPVTGEKFKVTAETLSASYKGKVYFFCCSGCGKPFIADPEKYLHKKRAVQARIYACPMGDYQGDKPGKCPKCGMTLEEKK